jgi:hypothetical protein
MKARLTPETWVRCTSSTKLRYLTREPAFLQCLRHTSVAVVPRPYWVLEKSASENFLDASQRDTLR